MMRRNSNSAPANADEQSPSNRREKQPPTQPIFDREILAQSDHGQSKQPPSNNTNTPDAERTTPSALSASAMNSAQLDWHTEMLCGLFLRSDEQELEGLEREVASHETSTSSRHGSSSQRPSSQSFPQTNGSVFGGKEGGSRSGGKEEHEETGIIEGQMVANREKSQQQTDVKEDVQTNQTCDFLMELLHLGHTMDSTVLSLIPEALRGVTSTLPEVQQNLTSKDNCCGNQKSEIPNAGVEASATASVNNTLGGRRTSDNRKETSRRDSDGAPLIVGTTAATACVNSNGVVAANAPGRIPLMNASTSNNEHGKDEWKEHENAKNEKSEHDYVKEGKNEQLDESDYGDFDKPLLIPSSWRRPDYARRTLPELEQHVIHSGKEGMRGNINGRNRTVKNGKKPTPTRGPKTYDLFTLLYNECSLSAMANWAMLDHSASGSSSNDDKKEQWEKSKKEKEKRRATEKGRYEVMVPPSTFHLCGVCGGFGHYEVECELLIEDDGKKRGRETSTGDEERKKPGPKKKKRVNGDSAKEVVLDEKSKNGVISSLSKEIYIQRRQQQSFENYCMQKKKDTVRDGNVQVASAASASESLNRSHGQKKEEEGDGNQYTGKSSCCNICHSGFDDGEMLLCDGCDELFHCKCLDPPLDSIPEGDWFCSSCISHDSDTSSIVEIEGCGDFVIEQRKRSVAEEAKLYSGVSLGQSKSSWTTALSLLPEQDPIVEDALYLQKHLGRKYGQITKDFFRSELCWAKRFDDQLGRLELWPGMVTDYETRSLKSSSKTTYTVKFFALDEDAEIHETGILPFMPYYEGIGHKRLIRCDNSGHETFRRALILCVSTLGLKSLGQTLKLARNGIQMAAVTNKGDRKLLPPGWKIPVGWESAVIDRIDGIVILAKEGGGELTPPQQKLHEALDFINNSDEAGGMTSNYRYSTGDSNDDNNPDQDSSASHKMVAEFFVDEVIGGVISWQSDFGASSSSESSCIRYGVVVSINTATEMALVRGMPMLSEVSSGKLDDLFHNDSNELLIHASNVGSSIWIPLRHVRFVSGKPSSRKVATFRRKLKSNMSNEMTSHSSQCKRDAKYREEYMMELEEPPDPDSMPIKDFNRPLLSCPLCSFQSYRSQALSMHVKSCEREKSRRLSASA